MNIIDWDKLWSDFDEWHRGRHSNGTWEGQKAAIERLVEDQVGEAVREVPGFE